MSKLKRPTSVSFFLDTVYNCIWYTINLKLVFRFLKGRFHDNRLSLVFIHSTDGCRWVQALTGGLTLVFALRLVFFLKVSEIRWRSGLLVSRVNNGSMGHGSNGSVFWMGHMGHGSMHFHRWPTCIFTNDMLVHLMHAISLPRSETCSFMKLWRLCQLC